MVQIDLTPVIPTPVKSNRFHPQYYLFVSRPHPVTESHCGYSKFFWSLLLFFADGECGGFSLTDLTVFTSLHGEYALCIFLLRIPFDCIHVFAFYFQGELKPIMLRITNVQLFWMQHHAALCRFVLMANTRLCFLKRLLTLHTFVRVEFHSTFPCVIGCGLLYILERSWKPQRMA